MPVLLYEKRNQIAYITLNRPDSLNAFNNELIEALGNAFVDYRDDPSLLVAIMSGTGRAFSTGADLKEMTSEGQHAGTRPLRTSLREQVWKPIIAAIDGYALAGGFGMALDCDIRLATERSRLGDVETRVSAWGNMNILGMVPLGEALHMILTGTNISAEEAYRMGLVHKVLPDRDSLIREAEAIAEQIKLCAPLAVQAVRRIAYARFMLPPNEIQELTQTLRKEVSQTEDAKEGPRAFAEKRKPVWKMR
ncbi:MAG: enoyl-CoA hydratase/isomerase family protein [Chloroflexi bacterium]|nr:enoyl-CoA hydratase/isomerase family protein [Chloroflexota bacterium]MCZ6789912.1 enoyl-CoA hydratase/isomerase family protein [Chloroflexota bacterium]MCZ6891398.1 enoyl-CoA hydratase/isomerase family protein [Chloroflexota bacterium]